MKKLIVGLGNPGEQYKKTRHNVGFLTIDKIAEKLKLKLTTEKFGGVYSTFDDFILAKPLTYMNLSGEFVKQVVDFFKINLSDIIIIHDDLDIPLGQARIKTTGSSGGHNGIKSIINCLGSEEFNRIKIGIGRPKQESQAEISTFVLSNFSKEEKEIIDMVIDETADAVISAIDNGIKNMINNFSKSNKR